jgi:hypothetical protein
MYTVQVKEPLGNARISAEKAYTTGRARPNMCRNFLVFTAISIGLLSSSYAEAQSGSRVCGWISEKAKIALAYEARQKSSTYTKQCNDATDELKKARDDPKFAQINDWKEMHKWECEATGGYTEYGRGPGIGLPNATWDICDVESPEKYWDQDYSPTPPIDRKQQMKAECAYVVVNERDSGYKEFSLTKLKCK